MNKEQFLRFAVVEFEIIILNWPRRRYPFRVLYSAKVFFSQAHERSAIHLGTATDKIMHG
jgi:hypothetical protein